MPEAGGNLPWEEFRRNTGIYQSISGGHDVATLVSLVSLDPSIFSYQRYLYSTVITFY